MTSLNEKPNRTEALKYYRKVAEHYRLNIHQYERVDRIAGEDNSFEVFSTDRLGAVIFTGCARSCSPPAITMWPTS
jgi:thioredoxin reductase (NADPH)